MVHQVRQIGFTLHPCASTGSRRRYSIGSVVFCGIMFVLDGVIVPRWNRRRHFSTLLSLQWSYIPSSSSDENSMPLHRPTRTIASPSRLSFFDYRTGSARLRIRHLYRGRPSDDTLANLGPLVPWRGSGPAPRGPMFIRWVPARTSPGPSSTATSTTSSSSGTSCNRSTRRPTDRNCSTACAITRTSSSRVRWRPSTIRSGTGSGNRPPGPCSTRSRFRAVRCSLAMGTAEPNATEFEVSADARLRDVRHLVEPIPRPRLPYGQLPHARHRQRDGTWSYEEHTRSACPTVKAWSITSTATRSSGSATQCPTRSRPSRDGHRPVA